MAKGLSHIVGIILALMIVIAISSGLYFWYFRLTGSQMGGVEQSSNAFADRLGSCLNVAGFQHNSLTNKSKVTLQNCGDGDIIVGDNNIIDSVIASPASCSFNLDRTNCYECPRTLKPGQIDTFTILWRYVPQCLVGSGETELQFTVDSLATASVMFTPIASACTSEIAKPVDITNTGSDYDKYSLFILLNTSAYIANNTMRSDCADLRFLDADQVTPLGFWIQKGCNDWKNLTQIWVNVPFVPFSPTTPRRIFMVYNDSGHSVSASNGTNAFTTYDQFDGSSVSSVWNYTNTLTGQIYVNGSYLYLNYLNGSVNASNTTTSANITTTLDFGYIMDIDAAFLNTTPDMGTAYNFNWMNVEAVAGSNLFNLATNFSSANGNRFYANITGDAGTSQGNITSYLSGLNFTDQYRYNFWSRAFNYQGASCVTSIWAEMRLYDSLICLNGDCGQGYKGDRHIGSETDAGRLFCDATLYSNQKLKLTVLASGGTMRLDWFNVRPYHFPYVTYALGTPQCLLNAG